VTWTRLSTDDAATWDSQLKHFEGHSLYQTWRWGRYKNARGWNPQHFQAVAHGSAVAMLQALVRTYPLRTMVAWCPGGPVGALDACTPESMRQLSDLMGARSLYFRSHFLRVKNDVDEQSLRSNGWTRPNHRVGTNMTAVWDLTQSEEQLLAGLNRDWRYNLRQAHKRGLTTERLVEPPIEELSDLCRAMNAAKGVSATVREAELVALFEALGDHAVVVGCRNRSGRLIAFRSCGLYDHRAWELAAATSNEGRREGASFAALWSLILHCRKMGVTHYDLAGVDDVNVPGVASFKRRTGAQGVEWLGEWEWSTSTLLRNVLDLTVRHRSGAALP